MKFHSTVKYFLLSLLFNLGNSNNVNALASQAAAALADHTAAAVGLFNNMRTPAALIAGGLVPIGILSAPQINDKEDSKLCKFMKRANILIGVISLLSEILAVIYSSIAINKLVEIKHPETLGVSQLIAKVPELELSWIGTNVHFFIGLIGFTALAGSKVYFSGFGNKISKISLGWACCAFLQATSFVNRGIAMGSAENTTRFASNLFTLCTKYVQLLVKTSTSGVLSFTALIIAIYSTISTIQFLIQSATGKPSD